MRRRIEKTKSSTNLGDENLLENLGVGGEATDTLVELVECHLVLEERPAEGGLVVNERDLLVLLATGSCGSGTRNS